VIWLHTHGTGHGLLTTMLVWAWLSAFGLPTRACTAPFPACCSLDHRLVNRFVATSLDLCSLQGVDQALCVDPLMSVFLNPWVPYPRCAKVRSSIRRVYSEPISLCALVMLSCNALLMRCPTRTGGRVAPAMQVAAADQAGCHVVLTPG
jgi:hypothetical protein